MDSDLKKKQKNQVKHRKLLHTIRFKSSMFQTALGTSALRSLFLKSDKLPIQN